MMDFKKLADPFAPEEIEWRVQQVTKNKDKVSVLAYLTSRAVMERLDEVCGPQNWKNEYQKGPEGGVLCGISIKVEGEWVTKWDGAENTDIEQVKGGLSGAMKRAAVQWGIGRYLYGLTTAYVPLKERGEHYFYDKDQKKAFYWDTPTLPQWALPAGTKPTTVNRSTGEIVEKLEVAKPTEHQIAVKSCETIEEVLKKSTMRLSASQVSGLRKKYTGVADLATAPTAKVREYLTALINKQKELEAGVALLDAGAPTATAHAN